MAKRQNRASHGTAPAIQRGSTFLRAWRKHRHLSQDDACERMVADGVFEITQGTLSKIERGEIPYNQDFLERAAVAYQCDIIDLLSVNPKRNDDPLRRAISALSESAPEMQRRAVAVISALLKPDGG